MTWFLNYTSPNPVLSITWDISGISTSLENYVKIFCKDVLRRSAPQTQELPPVGVRQIFAEGG
jgi:hypothetical protein